MVRKDPADFTVGFGYDLHVFDPDTNKPLILGGIEISGHMGLKAHSDGDVLTHAIVDALLGACDLGDIGHFFPDTDPKWSGASSLKMLAWSVRQANEKTGRRVRNVDCTIITQTPKISPYRDQIKKNLEQCMGIVAPCFVSIKSTTNEGVDAIGQKRAIAVHAVCLTVSI